MRSPIPNPQLLALGLGALAATLGPRLAAGEAAVQVYECNQGGRVTFSGTPCTDPGGDGVVGPGPAGQQSIEVDYARPDAAQARQAAQADAMNEYVAGTIAEADLLDTEILNLEKQITNREAERDARIAALRDQLAQGGESTDTAAWTADMNQQIEAVTASYNDTLLTERARLADLQSQRAALGRAGPAR